MIDIGNPTVLASCTHRGENHETVTATQPATTSAATSVDADSRDQTLSQLIAKILDQLSLSAWLPAFVMVASLVAVVHLRLVDGSVREAVNNLRSLGWTDLAMLFTVVVVLTVVTQAFEFGAIRVLEGYWSAARPVEWVADLTCSWQGRRRRKLEQRRRRLRKEAFKGARRKLRKDATESSIRGLPPLATDRDLELIKATVWNRIAEATPTERQRARSVPWMDYAPAEVRRRAENLDRRLREYPAGNRLLPTRLGNVLRSYEDSAFPTTSGPLEGAVQGVFDSLPRHVQAEHDHHRNRLNLYCSLVAVVMATTVASVAILWSLGWGYVAGALVVGTLVARRTYKAAIASAQAYGGLLGVISRYTGGASS